MSKKHWDCVINPPGMEYHIQVDHFNAIVMKFYFQKIHTVAFFGMLYLRLREVPS